MDRDKVVNDLKKIVGEEFVKDDPISIRLYSMNAAYGVGDAIAVVFPSSADEVSRIVRYCYKNDVKIYPQGSSTDLTGASIPCSDGIVVNFGRMRGIKEVSLLDSYVTVEPGLTIYELNSYLSKHNYMFPIDPASEKIATIGGAINAGAGGMRGAKYGTIKDWVLGLEVVLPDENGTILRIGGRVLKNREGYDLVRLIVGSEGTLALVTEATLKITPVPECTVYAVGFFEEIGDLMNAVLDVKKLRLDVLLMEFVEEDTVKLTAERIEAKVKGRGHMLLTGVVCNEEAKGRIVSTLREVYLTHRSNSTEFAYSLKDAEERGLLDIRRGYHTASIEIAHEKTRGLSRPHLLLLDVSIPPSKIGPYVSKLKELAKSYRVDMVLAGHISDGNLHPNIWVSDESEEKRSSARRLAYEAAKLAIEYGGVVASEHGVGIVKKEELKLSFEYRSSLKALDIMRGIKRVFDPRNILNPGKIFPDTT